MGRFWKRLRRIGKRIGKVGKGIGKVVKKGLKGVKIVNKFLKKIPGLNEVLSVAALAYPNISKLKNMYERAKAVTKLIKEGKFNMSLLGELARFVPQIETAIGLVKKGKKGLKLIKGASAVIKAGAEGGVKGVIQEGKQIVKREVITKIKKRVDKELKNRGMSRVIRNGYIDVNKIKKRVNNVKGRVQDVKSRVNNVRKFPVNIKDSVRKQVEDVRKQVERNVRKRISKFPVNISNDVPLDVSGVEKQVDKKKKELGKFFASVMSRRR